MRLVAAAACIVAAGFDSAAAGALVRMGHPYIGAACLVAAASFLIGGVGLLWGRR